ncbi:hypothetical protein MK852_13650 [Shewanella benthica]|uniref:hypothetical protein n=1 Tax=Shewanella benthica TaxID=43661 RepID=UPI0018794357|nr:hypothetical protein [Shewanella benthica]MBE7214710.1 hypothetical protein [Shewanella benthica]MCL1063154.1 hypothetical protein [Shewanella benthica]
MVDLKKLENFGLLMSYKALNNNESNLIKLLDNSIDELDLVLLSIASYHEDESSKLMGWIFNSLAKNKKQRAKCKNYTHATARSERLVVWENILKNKEITRRKSYKKSLDYICNLLMTSNDNFNRDFTFESELSSISVMQYRDNYSMQFIRAIEIFLMNSRLNSYVELFKSTYGVEVKDYIYVVYCTVIRFFKFKKIDYFRPYQIEQWKLLVEDPIFRKIDRIIVKRVLDTISNDIESYCDDLKNKKSSVRDFSVFCNKPLLKLKNEEYIPLDGKLLEDLIFNNLFYKFLDMQNNNGFMSDFGFAFEDYVCKLVNESCSYRETYTYIPEFEFRYNKNQNKSHDAIIYNESKDSALAIEVKSSRFLNSMLVSEDNNCSFDKTVNKLLIRPWEQMMKSLTGIMKSNAEPRFSERTTFFFLCVTMNDIPMYPLEITLNQEGRDITKYFFSMNIEAFEIFMEILSVESEYCFGSVLLGYLEHKKVMSIKTYLSRIREHNNLTNLKLRSSRTNKLNDFFSYIDG